MTSLSAGSVTAAIDSAGWTAIPLYGDTTADPNAKDFPSSLDQLGPVVVDLVGLGGGGAPYALDILLTWDEAGDYPILPLVSASTVQVGQATATKGTAIISPTSIVPLRAPSHMATTHRIYCWIRLSAADTATGATARIHWKQ